jgi:hypothetical protein
MKLDMHQLLQFLLNQHCHQKQDWMMHQLHRLMIEKKMIHMMMKLNHHQQY